ncbi:hypothetical protein F5Y14DRAFT_208446 [Nemania sp. NC0429]|nr:hypothetical protein F5Y14DRAFT_208446 [Nemania sp. NC0429]
MATITFDNNIINVDMDDAVAYVDLGFPGAEKLINNHKNSTPLTGSCTQAVSHFKKGTPSRKTFETQDHVSFPSGTEVTLTLGGNGDIKIQAKDNYANIAEWLSAGDSK